MGNPRDYTVSCASRTWRGWYQQDQATPASLRKKAKETLSNTSTHTHTYTHKHAHTRTSSFINVLYSENFLQGCSTIKCMTLADASLLLFHLSCFKASAAFFNPSKKFKKGMLAFDLAGLSLQKPQTCGQEFQTVSFTHPTMCYMDYGYLSQSQNKI